MVKMHSVPGKLRMWMSAPCAPHGLAGNREPQPKSGPVATAPPAERLERVTFAFRDYSAFIFNVDQEVRVVVGRCA
jgi:hypothetical protein